MLGRGHARFLRMKRSDIQTKSVLRPIQMTSQAELEQAV